MNLTNSLGANHRNFLGFAMADVQGFVKVPGSRFLNVLAADDQNGAAQKIATAIAKETMTAQYKRQATNLLAVSR